MNDSASLRCSVGHAGFQSGAGGQAVKQQARAGGCHADLSTRGEDGGTELEGDAVGQIGRPQPRLACDRLGVVDQVVTNDVQAHAFAEARIAGDGSD